MRTIIVLGLLCALGSFAGHASSARAQASDQAREREARAEFEAGVTAAQAADYARARAHFLRSRQLVVKASTLLNLALADLKLGLVDEALFALDAIEAPAEGPHQERLRRRAREMRSEVEALRDAIASKRSAEAPTTAPSEANVDPEHEADVRDAPAVEETQAPPAARSVALIENARSLPSAPRETPSLTGPRTLLAVGGVLGAAAIGTTLWWRHRDRDYDVCLHPRAGTRCPEQAVIGRERRAAIGVTAALGGAAVALIATGAIWLVGKKRDVRASSVSVSLWTERDRLGALASGRF